MSSYQEIFESVRNQIIEENDLVLMFWDYSVDKCKYQILLENLATGKHLRSNINDSYFSECKNENECCEKLYRECNKMIRLLE